MERVLIKNPLIILVVPVSFVSTPTQPACQGCKTSPVYSWKDYRLELFEEIIKEFNLNDCAAEAPGFPGIRKSY